MTRQTRRGRKKRPSTMVPTNALETMLAEYLDWTQVRNYSEVTVCNRRVHIGFFLNWCNERGLQEPVEITRPVLERYQRYLFHYRKKNGEPLSFHSQHTRLAPVRVWFKWLVKQNYLLANPASEIELPRIGYRLPNVLTIAEAEQVLAQPDIHDTLGLRDRAILETFYSTGMRRLELSQLKLFDLDLARGIVTIHQGKGKKDRVIHSAISVGVRSDSSTVVAIRRRLEHVPVPGCALRRRRRTVRLHNPVHKAAGALTALCAADGKGLVLPDAEFNQFVPHNRRHVHDSSVGKRVHDLITKTSLDFQSVWIGQRGGHRHIGFKHNSFFHGSPLS
jgi:integrase